MKFLAFLDREFIVGGRISPVLEIDRPGLEVGLDAGAVEHVDDRPVQIAFLLRVDRLADLWRQILDDALQHLSKTHPGRVGMLLMQAVRALNEHIVDAFGCSVRGSEIRRLREDFDDTRAVSPDQNRPFARAASCDEHMAPRTVGALGVVLHLKTRLRHPAMRAGESELGHV